MAPFSFIKNAFKRPPLERQYSIQIHGRGEDMTYTDPDIELSLERTYCDGHRLFCDNTQKDSLGNTISVEKRLTIIDNLCDHFRTKESATIFVLDVADKDHGRLESYLVDLATTGHKVSIEGDSAELREKHQDNMYLSVLNAGKKLSINGQEINSVEEYLHWKKNA